MYRKRLYLYIIPISIIVTLSVITYLNCLSNQFVYDDSSTIVENKLIKRLGKFSYLIHTRLFQNFRGTQLPPYCNTFVFY